MDRRGFITMSMSELDRLKVIQAVSAGMLMPWRAAQRLVGSGCHATLPYNRFKAALYAAMPSRRPTAITVTIKMPSSTR
jgi:hypothetical protein